MSNFIQRVRAIRFLLKLIGLFAGVEHADELAEILYWGILLIELIRFLKQMREDRRIDAKKDKLLGKASKGGNTLWGLLEGVIEAMDDHTIF